MESSLEIIPVPPLCFRDKETEARQWLAQGPPEVPGSKFSVHRKTPGCPHHTICPTFKNDIDLKSLVSWLRNLYCAPWNRRRHLLHLLSLNSGIISLQGGSEWRGLSVSLASSWPVARSGQRGHCIKPLIYQRREHANFWRLLFLDHNHFVTFMPLLRSG